MFVATPSNFNPEPVPSFFSCRLCIFATRADIHAIARHDPEAFGLVSDLEQKMNFTMRANESLLQIISAPLTDTAQYGSEEICDAHAYKIRRHGENHTSGNQ